LFWQEGVGVAGKEVGRGVWTACEVAASVGGTKTGGVGKRFPQPDNKKLNKRNVKRYFLHFIAAILPEFRGSHSIRKESVYNCCGAQYNLYTLVTVVLSVENCIK
jgi:hypothetical protein